MKGRRRLVLVVVGSASLIAAGATAAVVLGHGPASRNAAGSAALPAAVSSRLGLTSLDARPAPAFSLVDQRGRRVSLASLRGRVVVLEFFDPVCTDICPIVSREYLTANRLLGPQAQHAAFVAVNVNQFHRTVADVARFSRQHGLDAIPSWRFLTGPTPTLRRIWKAYGVTVEPDPTGDVVHSALVYFIDSQGRERYLAVPQRTKQAGIAAWGRGIAAVVRALDDRTA